MRIDSLRNARRSFVRSLALPALLAALLASPALASPAGGEAPSLLARLWSRFVLLAEKGPAFVLDGTPTMEGPVLTGHFDKEGSGMDPDGRPSAVTGDEGSGMDPDGQR